jgi:hypothetical protein
MPECPVCSSPVSEPRQGVSWCAFDCPRCGRYKADVDSHSIGDLLVRELGQWEAQAIRRRSRLSHVLRRSQPSDKYDWGTRRKSAPSTGMTRPRPGSA